MYAKHYENPTVLSKVTAKNVGDVFFETHGIFNNSDAQTADSDLQKFLDPRLLVDLLHMESCGY